ncbi:MAG: hypothetical protein ACYS7Y_31065 [Planctomycetota bacterium]|jgi:hypothetical protein
MTPWGGNVTIQADSHSDRWHLVAVVECLRTQYRAEYWAPNDHMSFERAVANLLQNLSDNLANHDAARMRLNRIFDNCWRD